MKNRTDDVRQDVTSTIERFRAHGLPSAKSLHFQLDDGDELKCALARTNFDQMGAGDLTRFSPEADILVRLNVDDEDLAVVYVAPEANGAPEDVLDRAIAVLEDLAAQLAAWRKADLS